MGHTRLGNPPTSKKWAAVVAAVAGEYQLESSQATIVATVEDIAAETLDAAQAGLTEAVDDAGLRYTYYLLTQLALSSRDEDWTSRLARIGISLPEEATIFDLAAELQGAIDDYLFSDPSAFPTDISEMAQKAAGEAVLELTGSHTADLFGQGPHLLRSAVQVFSTKKGFSELGQKFFGRFMAHFLNFYLSRATAASVGSNSLRHVGDLSRFNRVLETHCEQSARIVRDFCGEWYSKTEYLEGITLDNTSRFLAVALKKLSAELRRQEGRSNG